ncbi:hypothetical protein CYMTET_23657 [Cymbomonas tetramitiformis]|uniref:Uncharacterized protein n=1 Tax=Cymbomonas tetramitiformis TaxID=36881 RepID=A0AAE0L102_9CHLO|nr:hypothetical protein CYMTET_23657 [Cymbomonas tetramitiformis]
MWWKRGNSRRPFVGLRREVYQSKKLRSTRHSETRQAIALRYGWALVALPTLAVGLAPLLESVLAHPDDAGAIVTFLLAKRVYLYALAFTGLDLAARRTLSEPSALGQRFKGINEDLLAGLASQSQSTEEATQAYQRLDTVSESTQAAALPVLLAGSLAASVLGIAGIAALSNLVSTGDDAARAVLGAILPVSSLAGAVTVLLFSRAELRYVANALLPAIDGEEWDQPAARAAAATAILLVLAAYGGPVEWWPIRNAANVLVGITVARAAQFPRFSVCLAALIGVGLYDAAGTLLPLLSSLATSDAGATGASAMETVARSRLPAPQAPGALGMAAGWQPGVLAVVLKGRVTDALGLADFVFPAILAGFCVRFDARKRQEADIADQDSLKEMHEGSLPGYYNASAAGYIIGCFLLEFQGASVQPALVSIAPCMAFSVLGLAVFRGELSELWNATDLDANSNVD